MERIADHTFQPELLRGLPVLDAGCRYFKFSEYFARRGHRVIALDAARDVVCNSAGVEYFNLALDASSGSRPFSTWYGPESNTLTIQPDARTVQVSTRSVSDLMTELAIKHWDVVKLDIEGGEYEILLNWPGPVATQITVEFHEHRNFNLRGKDYYSELLTYLGKWYRPLQHEAVPCAPSKIGLNYWDSLFVLK